MRRALRVDDNAPLWTALQESDEIIPVLVLSEKERYRRSTPRRRFLRGALADLAADLRRRGAPLVVRIGDPTVELPALATGIGASGVYAAAVYDPASLLRDHRLEDALATQGISWTTVKDCVLFERSEVLTNAGGPFRVFTPYKRAWLRRGDDAPRPVQLPDLLPCPAGLPRSVDLEDLPGFAERVSEGGASAANARWARFLARDIEAYHTRRDLPGEEGTSRLSAHLAAGTISIRRLYWDARMHAGRRTAADREGVMTFIGQLLWREFFYQILAHFPEVAQGAFRREFASLPWSTDDRAFAAWSAGRTGYPIVDAAMRQLAEEGWMHNRARMITASFLTKDLHISWQHGERFFLEHLTDADIACNNGGWQWAAGTGTDASPWFRIFNPEAQGRRFDPLGNYVRRYVHELRHVSGKNIHAPWRMSPAEQKAAGCLIGSDYPAPIVDHQRERAAALALFRGVRLDPGRLR
jgi:deoxyribodipyrimidine photo-lyase